MYSTDPTIRRERQITALRQRADRTLAADESLRLRLAADLLELDGEPIDLDHWPAAQRFIMNALDSLVVKPEDLAGTITDENLRGLASIAWCGGINYWAGSHTSGPWEARNPEAILTFTDMETGNFHALTRGDLVRAYGALLDLDQRHVNRTIHNYFINSWRDRDAKDGIDITHIDADAADVWVQVAAFGKVIYG